MYCLLLVQLAWWGKDCQQAEMVESFDDFGGDDGFPLTIPEGKRLPALEVVQKGDRQRILVSKDAFEEMKTPFRWSVIGCFFRGTERVSVESKFAMDGLKRLWKPSSSPNFTALGKEGFLVRFAHAEDMRLALRQRAWRLARKTFVVNRWTPSLDLEVESSFKITVWNNSGGETASGACRRTATPCVDAERQGRAIPFCLPTNFLAYQTWNILR
ncbi:hypothetical protein EJ110_NYTH09589 [Nymphaea thermarum]|nr:hypothetical protein EJ110_NYTH09589 [Nymphaea thermarum]